METKLQVRNLRISFRTTNGKVQAVRGIDFDLAKGETLAIVGESGTCCGWTWPAGRPSGRTGRSSPDRHWPRRNRHCTYRPAGRRTRRREFGRCCGPECPRPGRRGRQYRLPLSRRWSAGSPRACCRRCPWYSAGTPPRCPKRAAIRRQWGRWPYTSSPPEGR